LPIVWRTAVTISMIVWIVMGTELITVSIDEDNVPIGVGIIEVSGRIDGLIVVRAVLTKI
jgi:hypothetical protein